MLTRLHLRSHRKRDSEQGRTDGAAKETCSNLYTGVRGKNIVGSSAHAWLAPAEEFTGQEKVQVGNGSVQVFNKVIVPMPHLISFFHVAAAAGSCNTAQR